MPYLGSTPNASFSSRTKQDFTANGSTTAFTLNSAVASPNDIEVFVGNVRQEPTDAYTVNGTTLTMSAAPANGINFYVVFKGLEENSVVPADGTISSAKLTSTALDPITLDSSNNRIGIGNTSPNRTVSIKHASQAEVGFKTGSVSNGALIYYNDSENKLLLRAQESGERIEFQTGGTSVRASITDDGICFGTDTAAANALDDYETGTWTPSTNIGFNSITDASYVKVGKLVFVNLSAQTNTGPNDVSQATSVSGLPFACRTGNAVSNSVIIEGLNQDVYAEIAGNSYSQIDKDNGTPITRGEFGNQRNCRVTLVYSIA